MKHVDDDLSARDPDRDLLALLDHQEQPDANLSARFRDSLADRMEGKRQAPAEGLAGKLFQRFWPSKPTWAFAYSSCMLLTGLVSGQWLRVPEPANAESVNPSPATALVCPVQTSPALWLPALERPSIA